MTPAPRPPQKTSYREEGNKLWNNTNWFWIGGNDVTVEGNWTWADGEDVSTRSGKRLWRLENLSIFRSSVYYYLDGLQ